MSVLMREAAKRLVEAAAVAFATEIAVLLAQRMMGYKEPEE